ncbi:GGDEF and EAL domain-containing protein [Phormidium tenue FACHB-886]|nr:GGDEF and EAL domain-containing protein [Phormidium tenue FACHB-886]
MTQFVQEQPFRLRFQVPTRFWWRFSAVVTATLVVFGLVHVGIGRSLERIAAQFWSPLQPPIAQQNWLGLGLLVIGLSLGAAMARWRFRYQMAAWIGLCLGWGILSGWLWRQGYGVPIATPMLLFSACGATVAVAEAVRTYMLLRQSEKRYALTVRSINEGFWDWDLQTNCVSYSPRWKEMLGYAEYDLSNRAAEWFDRVHPLDLEGLKQAIADYRQGLTPELKCEYRLLHQDGSYRWVQGRGWLLLNRRGKPERLVGFQIDITARKDTEAALQRSALHDPLTDLLNRAGFAQRVQQALIEASQNSQSAFAVLWLDIDQFKLVNNSLGSALGDRILVAVAQRLKAFLMPDSTVARLGGDEFSVLLQIHDASDATRMAERIQQILALPFQIDSHEVFITISVGVALNATHYTQAEQVLRDADTAMHRAKALGRARHQVFDRTMRTHMLVKLQLENDLRRAIAQEERHATLVGPMGSSFSILQQTSLDRVAILSEIPGIHPELQLHYQPIVGLATGLVVGFEALARWRHPERGLLPPAKFIPVAEETGLIIPLSWWVLRAACQQMRQWRKAFPQQNFLTMSVNLSSQQFSTPSLVDMLRQVLQETELDPAHLKLEMTESMVMNNAASVVEMLYQIRAQGIQLAIDDFGTGYSSLSYLPRFPINTLKIDRSFVSEMDFCTDSREIVRTILSLAHNLGIDVTAEGVETAEQNAQLLEMRCEHGQGYFFSEPLNATAMTQLLKRQQSQI